MGEFIIFLFIVAVAIGLVRIGYQLARAEVADARDELAREWRALEAERRISGLFIDASDQLRQAAAEPDRRQPTVIDGDWE